MVIDRFNMVDFEGIDLVNSRGLVVPGLHSKLVESITPCRYIMIYNFSFAGITIPPTVVEAELEDSDVIINEYIVVDANDEISIPSFEPILSILSVTSNGLYLPESGVEGFSRVNVEVPEPVLIEKTITENGTYDSADDSADGYSSVTVSVRGGQDITEFGESGISDSGLGWGCYSEYYTDTAGQLLGNVRERSYYKYLNGGAVCIPLISTSSSIGYTVPMLLSTNVEYAKGYSNYNTSYYSEPILLGDYLGYEWYGAPLPYGWTSNWSTSISGGKSSNIPVRYSYLYTNSFSNLTNEQKKHLLCQLLGCAGVHLI